MKPLSNATLVVVLCAVGAQIAAAQDLYSESVKLETITTTANKIGEEVFEVNTSVGVVSGSVLERQEIFNTQDLSKSFAGFNLNNNGSSAFPTATLRGLSSPDFYSTTFNLYVDGVPQSPNFLIQALGDVAQVELLRGPQGTLYGENSQAGLLHITTKNPMQKPYQNISITGSRLYEDINAYAGDVIVPNKLWLKGNLRYTHENGFIKDNTSSKMLNDGDSILAGLGLYWAVNDSLLATLSYNYYYSESHQNFALSKTQYENGYKLGGDARVVDSFMTLGSPQGIYNKNPFDKSQAHNASLKLDYEIGNSLLSSITAFQLTSHLNNTYPIVQLKSGSKNGYFYDNTQLIEELRLSTDYKNGAKSIVGAYYKYFITDNGMRGFEGTQNTFGFRDDWVAKESVNTFALFADGNLPLGNRFDIGLGARYQYYTAKMDSDVPPMATLPPIHGSKSWHSFNPRISLGFTASDETRLYVSATQSTKAGGFVKFPYASQDMIPYNPEQIYSAEIGSHSKFLGSKFHFNTALYYMLIKDRQSYVGSSIYQSLKNIGDAYSTGIDMDISYNGENITSFLGLNIGSARYKKGGDNKGTIVVGTQSQDYDVSGLSLKYSPLVSVVGGFDWAIARFNHHAFFFGANARLNSSYWFDDLDHRDDFKQKSFVVLDLNVRYRYKDWTLKLFSQNTTNARYATYARNMGIGESYYVPANPVNVGLSLSYSY